MRNRYMRFLTIGFIKRTTLDYQKRTFVKWIVVILRTLITYKNVWNSLFLSEAQLIFGKTNNSCNAERMFWLKRIRLDIRLILKIVTTFKVPFLTMQFFFNGLEVKGMAVGISLHVNIEVYKWHLNLWWMWNSVDIKKDAEKG